MKRTIVVTDIHGCYLQFLQLIQKCKYDSSKDEIIACGDLTEKGPNSHLVVSWFRRASKASHMKVSCVKGNHDESVVRFADHEERVLKGIQKSNPMKAFETRIETVASLSSEDVEYLRNLPMFTSREIAGTTYLFLHGGLLPGVPPERMDKKVICRLRWIARRGADKYKMIRAGYENPGGGDQFWAGVYSGNYGFIFYGHQPYDGKIQHWEHACGIDSGAVFGYKLTACIIDHDSGKRTFEQVPCEKYAEPWKRGDI